MFCYQCGERLLPEGQYCSSCGAKRLTSLSGEADPTTQTSSDNSRSTAQIEQVLEQGALDETVGSTAKETDFETKVQILSDLWLDYRDDENFKDFVAYNDLGLPLAYAAANAIVDLHPMAESFIEETFTVLLAALGNIADTGFLSLDDLLEISEGKN